MEVWVNKMFRVDLTSQFQWTILLYYAGIFIELKQNWSRFEVELRWNWDVIEVELSNSMCNSNSKKLNSNSNSNSSNVADAQFQFQFRNWNWNWAFNSNSRRNYSRSDNYRGDICFLFTTTLFWVGVWLGVRPGSKFERPVQKIARLMPSLWDDARWGCCCFWTACWRYSVQSWKH